MVAKVFFITLGLILIIFVFSKVKRNLFSEKESFFWMIGAVLVFLLSIFPQIIDALALALGVDYPPSLLFLLALFFVIFLLFRQSQQLSLINEKIKELVQRNALLEQKIREQFETKIRRE